MKCTIFGGGGFIGSTIVDRLLREGYSLKIFERFKVEPYRKFSEVEQVEWIHGDFSNVYDVNNAVKGSDVILHLISTTLPKSSLDNPIYDVQSNVVSTLQMLNAMVAHKVKKIVFISTGGTIYGNPVYLPIDEKHPTNPIISYAITKLMIEKYLISYKLLHGLKPIILRVANPYGERQSIKTAQGAVGIFLHHAYTNTPIKIWGDGSVIRDYIHVSDVAEAFLKAIEYSGQETLFNISSGLGTSLNELIEILEKVFEKSIECRYLPGRSFDISKSILSNQLAQMELKWEPIIPLIDGIKRTAKWMKVSVQ